MCACVRVRVCMRACACVRRNYVDACMPTLVSLRVFMRACMRFVVRISIKQCIRVFRTNQTFDVDNQRKSETLNSYNNPEYVTYAYEDGAKPDTQEPMSGQNDIEFSN